jgi:uncharacterized protein YndB with AHSA1/START domain
MNVESRTAMAPVRKTIEVPRDAATAFRAFADGIGRWWPLKTHTVSPADDPAQSCTIEPFVDGRVYETGRSGRETDWGRVRVYEPGRRLVFSWHLNRPIEQATEVEVRFTEVAPGRTRVELEHRLWEVVEDGARMREMYDSGWNLVFGECFGTFAAKA